MLHLTSHGVLARAKRALESGPARTTAISTTAGAVGLVAGKREDAKKVPIAAVAVGAALNVAGLHTLGDGSMAGGATLLGYRVGAKWARKEAAGTSSPAMPSGPRAPVAHAPGGGKRRG